MSANAKQKESINFKDLFTLHFLRALFKSLWLFFPAILFLLLAWAAFWQLSQGKDLLQRTLENRRIFALFIIAEIFWTYITWYTCYMISKIKLDRLPANNTDEDIIHWRRMLTQMPRFLAFSCLTIIVVAFLKLNADTNLDWLFYIILVASAFVYPRMYDFWSMQADKVDDNAKFPDKESKIKYLNKYRITTVVILALALIIITIFPHYFFLIFFLILFQVGLVLLLVFKKKRFIIDAPVLTAETQNTLVSKVKKHLFGAEEKFYTKVFIVVLISGLFFYISTIAAKT